MNRLRGALVLAGLLAIASHANAQDFKQRFVGKSPCAPDIQSEHSDFGMRLDKTENTRLLYRDLSNVKILMIVQPTANEGRCGVIADVVRITHIAKDFEFRCFDPQAPTAVIIGTAIRHGSTKLVTAMDAWRIDLRQQKFIEVSDRVTCSADGWAGEDDDGDLVDEAKKYAAHHKPGQFENEEPALPKDGQVLPLTQVTMDGKVIEGLQPKYPQEALTRRIRGTIALHVILEKDGTVKKVEVISGHPVFAQAAVDAVTQWKYQPTVSDGRPVEVDTLMYVKFALVAARTTKP